MKLIGSRIVIAARTRTMSTPTHVTVPSRVIARRIIGRKSSYYFFFCAVARITREGGKKTHSYACFRPSVSSGHIKPCPPTVFSTPKPPSVTVRFLLSRPVVYRMLSTTILSFVHVWIAGRAKSNVKKTCGVRSEDVVASLHSVSEAWV